MLCVIFSLNLVPPLEACSFRPVLYKDSRLLWFPSRLVQPPPAPLFLLRINLMLYLTRRFLLEPNKTQSKHKIFLKSWTYSWSSPGTWPRRRGKFIFSGSLYVRSESCYVFGGYFFCLAWSAFFLRSLNFCAGFSFICVRDTNILSARVFSVFSARFAWAFFMKECSRAPCVVYLPLDCPHFCLVPNFFYMFVPSVFRVSCC